MKSEPDVEILWRAFELRPEPVPTLPPEGEYLRRVWNSSVYPLAERMGITMKLPPVQPRSRLAHEAAHWARTQGRFFYQLHRIQSEKTYGFDSGF